MKDHNTKKKTGKLLSAALILMMTLSLVAGVLPAANPVNAAADFSYPSPFNKTGYSMYYHKGKYAGNLIVNGVDISDWQSKNCRFDDAKAAGVDYAIMRVTYSSYSKSALSLNIDEKFFTQYSKAKANGVMTGVYVFSQATSTNEAIKEANYAVKRLKALGIGPKDLNLPVYMDYEFAGGVLGRMHGITKTQATNSAVAFCNAIKAAGYQPGIYANTTFFDSYIATSQLASDVDIWCAQYYSRNQSAVKYSKWQYSSSARIDGMLSFTGFQGKIDADFWYLNKRKATSSVVTKICGKTTLSVSDAKKPKFRLYSGSKLLKEGVDYNVGGIRNNVAGRGYAYIKGIGKYSGYALIPLRITKKSAGKSTDVISCANYLKKASSKKSRYISVTPIKYEKGKTYVIQDYLNIRKGAGTGYDRVLRTDLSATMMKKTSADTKYAVLKPGSKVKCLKISGDWMKISGGWICCKMGSEIYVN